MLLRTVTCCRMNSRILDFSGAYIRGYSMAYVHCMVMYYDFESSVSRFGSMKVNPETDNLNSM